MNGNNIPNWRNALALQSDDLDFQMPLEAFSCDADVNPSRFVMITGNMSVSQCVPGVVPYGISVEYPANMLGGPAASAGNFVRIYGLAYECWLLMAQACNYGDPITSNYDGRGVVGQPCGAIALSAANPGDLCRVRIHTEPTPLQCEFTPEYDQDYNRCSE